MSRLLLPALAALYLFASPLAATEQSSPSDAVFSRTLPDARGQGVAMSSYRGKALIVNFWARWCAPCREEIPELNQFRQAHKGKVDILGIGLEDNPADVSAFRRKIPMNYPVFLGGDDAIPLMQALGNRKGALPYTVFIHPNGQIVGEKLGRLSRDNLERALDSLTRP